MDEEVTAEDAAFVGGGLVDVTGLSLADLDRVDNFHLKHALRRILDDDNTGPVAGFTSSI
ncbi:FxSxx-COOH cyclophane-containing RiPP peptide [Streptosporangium fragile]|uniref:FxSxx-COOH cyclophane-containing RiPP peptide n=1 Tax=Streptosporangium fragile TaxID=46186 RepID=UPI0031E9F42A